jgi:hypothetical protein
MQARTRSPFGSSLALIILFLCQYCLKQEVKSSVRQQALQKTSQTTVDSKSPKAPGAGITDPDTHTECRPSNPPKGFVCGPFPEKMIEECMAIGGNAVSCRSTQMEEELFLKIVNDASRIAAEKLPQVPCNPMTSTDYLNLRSSPQKTTDDSNIIRTLPVGTSVTVLDTKKSPWFQVKVAQDMGFVSKDYLMCKSSTNLPTTDGKKPPSAVPMCTYYERITEEIHNFEVPAGNTCASSQALSCAKCKGTLDATQQHTNCRCESCFKIAPTTTRRGPCIDCDASLYYCDPSE